MFNDTGEVTACANVLKLLLHVCRIYCILVIFQESQKLRNKILDRVL